MGFIPTVNGSGGFTATVNGQSALLVGMSTVGIKGDTGPAGANGSPGVVAATAPITYNAGTQTVAMDTSYFLRSPALAGTDGQIVSWDAATSRPLWIDNAARTLFATVRNETGATLTKGTVVYISGASGNKPLVSKAQANTDANSAQTFAVLSVDIPNNQNGTAIVAGELTKLDTSVYAEGAALYLSPTVAGGYTTTKPSAPNHLVYVATVVRSHATQGIIEVRIQNGYELEELHNVAINGKADKDLLAYDSATSLWKNRTASALDLATMTWATAAFAPAGWNPFNQTLNTNSDPQFTSARVGALIVKQVGETPTYPSDYQFVAYKPELVLLKADNLSGLASASTARTNLGLGTAATASTTDFAAAVHTHTASQISDSTTAGRALLTAADAAAQRTSLGLGTMATETAANYLTTSAAATTYYPIPTGTTSQYLRGNGTLSTFSTDVIAAVPAASTTTAGKVQLATLAEAATATATDRAVTPQALQYFQQPGWFAIDYSGTTAVTSTGTTTTSPSGMNCRLTATASGQYGIRYVGNAGGVVVGFQPGQSTTMSWSRRFILAATVGFPGTANITSRIKFNNGNPPTSAGDLAGKGVAVRRVGTGALELQVHNGTTLTNVTSSLTPSTTVRIVIDSDGAGNVTLYADTGSGLTSIATTSAGPTGAGSNYPQYIQEIESTGSSSVAQINCLGVSYYLA